MALKDSDSKMEELKKELEEVKEERDLVNKALSLHNEVEFKYQLLRLLSSMNQQLSDIASAIRKEESSENE